MQYKRVRATQALTNIGRYPRASESGGAYTPACGFSAKRHSYPQVILGSVRRARTAFWQFSRFHRTRPTHGHLPSVPLPPSAYKQPSIPRLAEPTVAIHVRAVDLPGSFLWLSVTQVHRARSPSSFSRTRFPDVLTRVEKERRRESRKHVGTGKRPTDDRRWASRGILEARIQHLRWRVTIARWPFDAPLKT